MRLHWSIEQSKGKLYSIAIWQDYKYKIYPKSRGFGVSIDRNGMEFAVPVFEYYLEIHLSSSINHAIFDYDGYATQIEAMMAAESHVAKKIAEQERLNKKDNSIINIGLI